MIEEITGLLICLPPQPKITSYLFLNSRMHQIFKSRRRIQEDVPHTHKPWHQSLGRRLKPFPRAGDEPCPRLPHAFRHRKHKRHFPFAIGALLAAVLLVALLGLLWPSSALLPAQRGTLVSKKTSSFRLCSTSPMFGAVRIHSCPLWYAGRFGIPILPSHRVVPAVKISSEQQMHEYPELFGWNSAGAFCCCEDSAGCVPWGWLGTSSPVTHRMSPVQLC